MTRNRFSQPALAAAFGAFALAATAAAAPPVYQIDEAHSSAQFSVRHLMISNVKGQFNKVGGTVVYDPNDLAASRIDAVIDATTVDTGNAKRDAHLKSADFFDAAKYPALTFKSKEFRQAHGKLQVRGDLTMHGVTKEVVLYVADAVQEVKDPWGNLRFGASATTRINRKDWGLTWNQALEAGGVAVGDEVTITIDLEAIRKSPTLTSEATRK